MNSEEYCRKDAVTERSLNLAGDAHGLHGFAPRKMVLVYSICVWVLQGFADISPYTLR